MGLGETTVEQGGREQECIRFNYLFVVSHEPWSRELLGSSPPVPPGPLALLLLPPPPEHLAEVLIAVARPHGEVGLHVLQPGQGAGKVPVIEQSQIS